VSDSTLALPNFARLAAKDNRRSEMHFRIKAKISRVCGGV
jgi:hypothetical protein